MKTNYFRFMHYFGVLFMSGVLLMLAPCLAMDEVRLALNWKPEPEFGGFYEALRAGIFEKNQIKLKIIPGGAGQPVVQMLGAKNIEFGIVAADEIVLSQQRGSRVVALFTVYQDNPQGFMVHPERSFKSLKEMFQSEGVVALQKGQPYSEWLLKKYAPIKAKIVPYTGGISLFLKDPQYSQQCFVTSEPLLVTKSKTLSKTFLISESGFNPYIVVLAAHEDYVQQHSDLVKRFIKASREGWIQYQKNPSKTNELMSKLNPSLDLEIMNQMTVEQNAFVFPNGFNKSAIGSMQESRWKEMNSQLKEIGLITKNLDPLNFFKKID